MLSAGTRQLTKRSSQWPPSLGVGNEPLVAVDDPGVTVPDGSGLDLGRVGAGDFGLGHRDARPDVVGDERLEIRALLCGCRREPQDFGIAGIWRRGTKNAWCDRAPTKLFVDQAERHVAHAQAACFGR
jgi:hypothetical protein